ncbi:MAG TPA: SpoIIE family protein phosphatase [Thermoguttaceae bacterium]|nr:SpoIIE family protein phosphatase [Thermoguttaceae bacterium]
MSHTLEVLEGSGAGHRFELSRDEILVGRGLACQIVLDSPAVSRTHARLVLQGDTYAIEDMGSRGHTLVNDRQIAGRVRLADGDRVKIADVPLVFRSHRPEVSEKRGESTTTILRSLDVRHGPDAILKVNAEAKLRAILQITRALGRTLDLEALLSKMLDGLFQVFPLADRGLVLLVEGDRLVPRAAKHRHDWQESIQYSKTIVHQAMDQRQAILSEDAAVDERFTQAQSIADFRIRSIMCVPLLAQEMNPLGVIQLDTQRPGARFTDDDMQILASVATQASVSVEYAQLHKQRLKQAKLEREMDIAQDVQRNFLPRSTPDLEGYDFWAYYLAAGKVGGDYYDFIRLPNGNQAVLLGDVSGKGVPAALLMAKASAVCKVALLSCPDRIDEAMHRINNEICDASTGGTFLTLVLCVIDPQTHDVTLANAGHMSPMFRRADSSIEEPAESNVRGFPLGIVRDSRYATTTVGLAAGESVLMFSDGISEATSLEDELYSDERVGGQLRRMEADTAAGIGQALLEDVRRHAAGCEQSDDISLVVFRRNPA